MRICALLLVLITGLCCSGILNAAPYNPPERIMVVRPTFEGNTERTIRYKPDGMDFVIENGSEFFNRPLYGGNTAFRVDAGDKPEFSLYLPGHGGNLRFGIRTVDGLKWLHKTDTIISRYRPGAMIYEIRDELLKNAVLHLSVMGLYEKDGLIIQAKLNGDEESVELIAAFGGANGKRGKRGGDIGCESQPVSAFFQLQPQNCKDNDFTIRENQFILKSKPATIAGVFSENASLAVADAAKWNSLKELIVSAGELTEQPVITAVIKLSAGQAVYTALERITGDASDLEIEALPALYESTEQRRREIAYRVAVETPDPYINAAASALCVAADAIWDEQQGSVMHGAVAWRSKYLGWRGPYANDVLGWHDRAERHLTYWAQRQDTTPVPDNILPADPTAHLARNEPSLHSNGALSHKHYDMNLVYMDALFRHILWTGDLELARELWPVIERHIAWERRLFRRPFGEEKLPLYEAYAAIWASDDLQYHGGGVTHASAYNYYHNRMVARLAKALGKDPAPYEKEADLILKAMQKYLWLEDRGWYAEYKDLLGRQAVHPSAALWTFYHTLDSQAADPMQAWQMSRFVDTQIAHIPVYGGDIPKGQYYTLPTTSWMPYTWSVNNVVMAEVAHTSLAYWQAGRPDKAFSLFKGCILDSMYMGKCPGNAGMTTYFDMARGEAQRDFGDGVGMLSRALIEGLFGIQPDIPAGKLTITPGFPDEWTYAKLRHPDFMFFDYKRSKNTEIYSIKTTFQKAPSIELKVKARGTKVSSVTDGLRPVNWSIVEDAVGCPYIVIHCNPNPAHSIEIVWSGSAPADTAMQPVAAKGAAIQPNFNGATVNKVIDSQSCLDNVNRKTHSFTAKTAGLFGHRSVFAKLKQGQMQWAEPVEFEIRKPFEITTDVSRPANAIRFQIQNNTDEVVDTEVQISVGTSSEKREVKIPAHGRSEMITLSADDFDILPGSNCVRVRIADGITAEGRVVNWHINPQNMAKQSRSLDLTDSYNDRVTQIFENEYLTPRSPYCSLAIPKQGIGSWCNFAKSFDVDDSGLRSAARKNDGCFILPQGIRFDTPTETEADNVIFTSQWDNYPDDVTVSLNGKGRHLYLLMAGSTNSMQSRFDNGAVIVTYADGSTERLVLRNPTTWWPIDQDYFIDDFGFNRPEPIPPRVDLKTGKVRILDVESFKGKGGPVEGGAATVLDLPLDADKELVSLTVRTLANEVVIGLMSATLVR